MRFVYSRHYKQRYFSTFYGLVRVMVTFKFAVLVSVDFELGLVLVFGLVMCWWHGMIRSRIKVMI